MQNFGRLMLIGGCLAGGYIIYRLSREWWNQNILRPPSSEEGSPYSIDVDRTENSIYDNVDNDCSEDEELIRNETDCPDAMPEASPQSTPDATSENSWPLAEDQMLSSSEIDLKLANEEMFAQGDVVGAFDFYDEESILTKLRSTTPCKSPGEATCVNVEEEPNTIEIPQRNENDDIPENDDTTLPVIDIPRRRERKRFKNIRKFFKSLSCFGKGKH